MDDLISRAAAKKIVSLMVCAPSVKIAAEHSIDDLPAVDAVPVVHGKWKYDLWFMTCSNCGCCLATKDDEGQWIPQNYCPECGAKMSGGASDDGVFIVEPKRIGVDIHEQELVMCKHCKHATMILADVMWCDRCNNICADDWFCADGERREEHG